jgi:AraC family ethanolamine operon transcriptional activator
MFGVGPNRYLHIRRLHLVRVALSIANPNTESVSQIALRFGFSDSGRMASNYHRLFGEYPSKP